MTTRFQSRIICDVLDLKHLPRYGLAELHAVAEAKSDVVQQLLAQDEDIWYITKDIDPDTGNIEFTAAIFVNGFNTRIANVEQTVENRVNQLLLRGVISSQQANFILYGA